MNLLKVKEISHFPENNFTPDLIKNVLFANTLNVLTEFYEMQSQFLINRYKMNSNMESSNIITLLTRQLHLEILRQKERNLNYNISLRNFIFANNYIRENFFLYNHGYKIVTISEKTGIPKETVRRKLRKLVDGKVLNYEKKSKFYFYNLNQRNEELFNNFIKKDIETLSKFFLEIAKCFDLNFKQKDVENEIKSQFSFYYYHFYNCQLSWMKMWMDEIKDLDLIFIAIQALIPALKSTKKDTFKKSNMDNFYSIVGKTDKDGKYSSISANSISQISGIPRPTCIRKLEKLVKLGMLVKENKSKRFLINQTTLDRSKYITTKDNVVFTINIFSEFLSIALQALTRNQRKKY